MADGTTGERASWRAWARTARARALVQDNEADGGAVALDDPQPRIGDDSTTNQIWALDTLPICV
jgi:hypothetical protein